MRQKLEFLIPLGVMLAIIVFLTWVAYEAPHNEWMLEWAEWFYGRDFAPIED